MDNTTHSYEEWKAELIRITVDGLLTMSFVKIGVMNVMHIIDKGTDSERIVCRVMIIGTYKGEMFVYQDGPDNEGSQYYWVKDNMDPSTFWWTDGNMACDCNRSAFLPEHLYKLHGGGCGHEIKFDRIIPIEGENLPILILDES